MVDGVEEFGFEVAAADAWFDGGCGAAHGCGGGGGGGADGVEVGVGFDGAEAAEEGCETIDAVGREESGAEGGEPWVVAVRGEGVAAGEDEDSAGAEGEGAEGWLEEAEGGDFGDGGGGGLVWGDGAVPEGGGGFGGEEVFAERAGVGFFEDEAAGWVVEAGEVVEVRPWVCGVRAGGAALGAGGDDGEVALVHEGA